MKAGELRLGNLFIEEYTNSIIQVIQLETDKIFFSLKFVSQWQAKPIPLTEEWLVKFGFKRFPWGLVKENLLFRDDIRNPCKELWLEVGNGYRVHIKYLHQLQNLYFALTGEELTIKE